MPLLSSLIQLNNYNAYRKRELTKDPRALSRILNTATKDPKEDLIIKDSKNYSITALRMNLLLRILKKTLPYKDPKKIPPLNTLTRSLSQLTEEFEKYI